MSLLALAPLIAIAVVGGVALVLRVQRNRQLVLLGQVVETHVSRRAAPSILYFTGANCTICHTAQEPALRTLATGLDASVQIREVDVASEPGLARRYRVMSLPTTVVLDAEQTVRHINVGFATATTLRAQLIEAGLPVAA